MVARLKNLCQEYIVYSGKIQAKYGADGLGLQIVNIFETERRRIINETYLPELEEV